MKRRRPLLGALIRRLAPAGRKAAPGPGEAGGKLFRDAPADWKDAVYSPRMLRKKRA